MNCTTCNEIKSSENCECCNVRLCVKCIHKDAEGKPFCGECHALLLADEEAA